MQELITLIADKTGLEMPKAEMAVGIILNLIATQGDKTKVDVLLAKLPGARELVTAHGGDGAGGRGLMGILAGGMMGGPLAMITKLQSAGLSTDQTKTATAATLDYVRAKAGKDLLQAAAANIPGLGAYL